MAKFDYELSAQIILSEDQQATATSEVTIINIINPFIQLTVPFLKTTQNLMVTILIFGTDDKKRDFNFVITDNTGENDEKISIVNGSIPDFPANDISSVNMNIGLRNVIFKNEGKHMASLYVEDKLVSETPFYVVIKEME